MANKLLLFVQFVAIATIASCVAVADKRATGGYVQNTSGGASFTHYSGCSQPGTCATPPCRCVSNDPKFTLLLSNSAACGVAANGYTAAVSQLAFGSSPGLGPGDACGRCFAITANADPYSPAFTGPFKTIIVKVTDLCPVAGNQEWCSQSTSNPNNQHNEPVQYALGPSLPE